MSTIPVIDIANADAVAAQLPVRRLVSLVLLLAVKDRATEVRFEPSVADGEWKLRYEIDGRWYDMAPVPLDVPISREIRRLGERTIRWAISGQAVEITVLLSRAGRDSRQPETAVLRLPHPTGAADQAGRVLGEYLEKWCREEALGS
jgi:hypothetical protein